MTHTQSVTDQVQLAHDVFQQLRCAKQTQQRDNEEVKEATLDVFNTITRTVLELIPTLTQKNTVFFQAIMELFPRTEGANLRIIDEWLACHDYLHKTIQVLYSEAKKSLTPEELKKMPANAREKSAAKQDLLSVAQKKVNNIIILIHPDIVLACKYIQMQYLIGNI